MTARAVRRLSLAFLAALIAWLFWAALVVDIEPYDGFETLVNSRYFLGRASYYNVLRGPLLALVVAPAEWLKLELGLHPLEVRPHHLTMAALHAGYLVASLHLVRRFTSSGAAALLAFAAAVTTYVFFSYAPFLSHDLVPGAMFLAMIVLAADYLERGGRGRLAALVALGAAAALLKLLYGVFFLALLPAAVFDVLQARGERAQRARRFLELGAAASLAGALTWAALAAVSAGVWPEVSAALRPWRLVQEQSQATLTLAVDPWLYARNLPAYGLTPLLLLVPGLGLAFRGAPRQRMLAVSLVLAAAGTQVLAHREVRYLAYLSPLCAALIAPVIERALRRRWLALGVIGLCGVDLARALPEALHVSSDFSRRSLAKQFLEPLGPPGAPLPPLVMVGERMLSFRDPAPSRLVGDRYHRVFHLSFHHFLSLWGYSPSAFLHLEDPRRIPDGFAGEGAVLLLVEGVLHGASEDGGAKEHLREVSAVAERDTLTPTPDGWASGRGGSVQLQPLGSRLVLEGEPLRFLAPLLFPAAALGGSDQRVPLRRIDERTWALDAQPPELSGRPALGLSGFRPRRSSDGERVASPGSRP